MLLVEALRKPESQNLYPVAVSCEQERNWAQGRDLVETLARTEIKGLSGVIKFDENRTRSDFHLDIIQLLAQGLQEVINN